MSPNRKFLKMLTFDGLDSYSNFYFLLITVGQRNRQFAAKFEIND